MGERAQLVFWGVVMAACVVGAGVVGLSLISADEPERRADTIASATTAPPAETPTASVEAVDPAAIVLTLNDMPPGYSPDPDQDPAEETRYCTGQTLSEAVPFDAEANGEQFTAGPTGPSIGSVATRYSDDATANQALDTIVDFLAECGNAIEIPSSEGPVSMTMAPLSFDAFGDRTLALRGSIDVGGVAFTVDYVLARVGRTVVGLIHSTLLGAAPDPTVSADLVGAMVERA